MHKLCAALASDTSNGRYGNMACSPGSTPQCAQPSFDSLTNRIFQMNGVTASYDAAGNLTGDGSNSYQWDGEGRAKSVGGGRTATFTYNAFGRLVETIASSPGSYKEEFPYGPSASHWGGAYMPSFGMYAIRAGDP